MQVPLFLVESLGAPRNHHALFVKVKIGGRAGALFQVEGNVQTGMEYKFEVTEAPEESASFLSMTQLGWVSSSDLERIDEICRSNPPPEKQFDGPRRMNLRKALRRCQEWTAETIGVLKAEGVLKQVD